jgi:hypothetical protein
MNREKSAGGKALLRVKLALIALVLISITLNACPPLEEDPYNNTLVYNGQLDLTSWMEILIDIHERGMPVNLDLSACTVGADVLKHTHQNGDDYTASTGVNEWDSYYQFDPIPSFPYGKNLIRNLVLPKAATMIRNATPDIGIQEITEEDKKRSAFRHFTNLRSVTGENIRLIGNLAFTDCLTLEEANFSRAVHIMQFAFYGCASLRQVRYEYARDLLQGAFENCISLQKADFPYVGTVSQNAFRNCFSLTEVNFPIVTKIGDDAFRNCIGLRIARFYADPDPIGGNPAGINPPPDASIIFYPNAFRGCISLETLDVRFAWNVYFARGVLAEIGMHLDLHLFDDDGTKSYGHPQSEWYLGNNPYINDDPSLDELLGYVTLRSIKIISPVTSSSQIEDPAQGIYHDIRGKYGVPYFVEEIDPETGDPTKYRVNVERVPALP